MIIKEKLDKPYKDYSTKATIWLQCDYCGCKFTRIKRSRDLSNKNVNKDSCDHKNCKSKKKKEIYEYLQKDESYKIRQKEIADKKRKNNLKKYGCENYFESEDFKKKRLHTLMKKYGVTSLYLNPELLKKYKETCIQRYGVDNYAKYIDFYQRVISTNLEKYGYHSATLNKDVLQKRKDTSVKKYGKEHYTQTIQYIENRTKLWLELYGVEHTSKLKSNRDKAKDTCKKRYGVENYAQTEAFKSKYSKVCYEKYGVPNPLLLKKNQVYGKTQAQIKNWLTDIGFIFESSYTIVDGKEIDLYNDKLKIGIEYCGLYWHNELSLSPRNSKYHYDKFKKCQEKNVRLLTIFEDEWKNQQELCKSRIMSILGIQKNKVFARKCKSKELSRKEFNDFCNINHLQKSNNLGLVYYGLFYRDEMVAGMSLGRHHRNSKVITLDRLCFKKDFNVVGGSSKLFKLCLEWAKNKHYKSIISWSDNRWSAGSVYQKLGFKLEKELKADYSYVNFKNPTQRISKQSQAKNNNGCPIDKTEREWCLNLGLARIWDCGKKRWKYEIN